MPLFGVTWPEPFLGPDKASIYAQFQADINKGWEQQCILGDPHFEANSAKLSPSGLIKLRWILTQNPPEYRTPFIERTASDEITARRVAASSNRMPPEVDTTRGADVQSTTEVKPTPKKPIEPVASRLADARSEASAPTPAAVSGAPALASRSVD